MSGRVDGGALDRFEAAMTTPDLDTLIGLLAEDVVLHSPTTYRPFRGAATVRHVLGAVVDVIADLHYVRRLGETSTVFAGHIGETELEGVDLLQLDDVGRIAMLTIMVRPLSGLSALSEAMGARLVR